MKKILTLMAPSIRRSRQIYRDGFLAGERFEVASGYGRVAQDKAPLLWTSWTSWQVIKADDEFTRRIPRRSGDQQDGTDKLAINTAAGNITNEAARRHRRH